MNTLHIGDNLEYLRTLPDNSVDAVITDPPYGLGKEPDPLEVLKAWTSGDIYQPSGKGFHGHEWDAFVPSPVLWKECLRVLKPGGHLVSFGGTRTYDWIVLGLRIAGFEIRDMLVWAYGQGMPKGLNVSKAIDKQMGLERPVVGKRAISYADSATWGTPNANSSGQIKNASSYDMRTGKDGGNFGGERFVTGPASELSAKWEGWNTALKPALEPIVMARKPLEGTAVDNVLKWGTGAINVDSCRVPIEGTDGRYPANLIHDGQVDEAFDASHPPDIGGSVSRYFNALPPSDNDYPLFYAPKASKSERNQGGPNSHPTVKNVALMRWLVRMVVPENGIALDPYAGSGTTLVACALESRHWIGCEISGEYAEIARKRIAHAESTMEPEDDGVFF